MHSRNKLRPPVYGILLLVASMLNNGCGAAPAARLEAAPAAQGQAGSSQSAPTREGFDRVRLGMTEAEANKILGSPYFSAATGTSTIANWGNDSRTIALVFEQGRLIQRSASGMPQDTKKLTAADPARIVNGMSEADVAKLLGPSHSEVELKGQKVLVWEQPGQQITVQLHEGKVTLKTIVKL